MGVVKNQPPIKEDDQAQFIIQLDGNVSVSSLDLSACENIDEVSAPHGSYIPVFLGYRQSNNNTVTLPAVRQTIRRDNKILQAVTLPRISCYNMRSLWSKLDNLGEDIYDRNTSISFLTAIWQKSENKKHQFKIEELFEMKGLKYISTPRPGARRGGGAAIVVNTEKFSISKLNISHPNCLEIVWGLLKPHEVTGKINKIIVCCFYCPPKSTRKTVLIEHMTLTLQSLLTTFPKAGVLISGDRNDLSIERLLTVDSSLRQLVLKGTRGLKVLDIVLTNLAVFFQEPVIVPPIQVDNPCKPGVPSDHKGVVVIPKTVTDYPLTTQKYVRTIRPITTSAINNIGQVLTKEKWLFMDTTLSSTDLTELFQYFTGEVLNIFCPTKNVYARPNELPWVTENMKALKRARMTEYEKRGKSIKYFELKSLFEQKMKNEVMKYKIKYLITSKMGTEPVLIQRCTNLECDPVM